MARGVTKREAEQVLRMAAAWLGKHGMTDDGSPAPTGEDAAYRGLGPMLEKRNDWGFGECWTVLLEGGPYEWAIDASFEIQAEIDKRRMDVFVEPGWSFSLCLNRK